MQPLSEREHVTQINWLYDGRPLRQMDRRAHNILYYATLQPTLLQPILQPAQYQLTAKPMAEHKR